MRHPVRLHHPIDAEPADERLQELRDQVRQWQGRFEGRRFDFERFYTALATRGFVIYPGKLTRAESFRIGCIGALEASLKGSRAPVETSRLSAVMPSSRELCTSMTRGQEVPREMPRTFGASGLVTGSVAVDPARASRLSALVPAPPRLSARKVLEAFR